MTGPVVGPVVGPVTGPVVGAVYTTYRWTVSSTQMIDWDLAISTGTRWARPGPQVSLAEARRTVAELRDLAGAVQQPVHEVTGMAASADGSVRIVQTTNPSTVPMYLQTLPVTGDASQPFGFRFETEPFQPPNPATRGATILTETSRRSRRPATAGMPITGPASPGATSAPPSIEASTPAASTARTPGRKAPTTSKSAVPARAPPSSPAACLSTRRKEAAW